MIIKSKQIKGQGRGHKIGFPTINLEVPIELHIDDGIYACWIVIDDKTYKGALHYGSIPTFNQKEKSLEIHLLDVTDENSPESEDKIIEIDIVEKLRDIKNFDTAEELAAQIELDIQKVKSVLK
jgi:riboflavin kinase / FMN adenylyltransferase